MLIRGLLLDPIPNSPNKHHKRVKRITKEILGVKGLSCGKEKNNFIFFYLDDSEVWKRFISNGSLR